MLDFKPLMQFQRIADLLAKRGWAEANAGNLSLRVNRKDLPDLPDAYIDFTLKTAFPGIDGDWFLVTATKSRARDVVDYPEGTIGLHEIIDDGTMVRCHWGASPPTSEFPAHMGIYQECVTCRPEINAVLHTHPPNLIAMSHLPDLQVPGKLNAALRTMHPEVPILVPDGVAHLNFEIPGSNELGIATSRELLKKNIAIWPMHGVVSIADNLDRALDQVEIIEKAATIYMLVRSTGQHPVGLSMDQIVNSRKYWGVEGDLD